MDGLEQKINIFRKIIQSVPVDSMLALEGVWPEIWDDFGGALRALQEYVFQEGGYLPYIKPELYLRLTPESKAILETILGSYPNAIHYLGYHYFIYKGEQVFFASYDTLSSLSVDYLLREILFLDESENEIISFEPMETVLNAEAYRAYWQQKNK